MRKLILLFVLFLSSVSLKSQEASRFGIDFGINVAKMIMKNEYVLTADLKPLVGLKGYVFYDLPLGRSFSLQNEFGYDGTGFKYQNFLANENLYTQTFSYLTLSVLPAYNLHQTGLSFFAGPSVGYLFHGNATGGGRDISSTTSFKSFDLFVVVGEEYFFPGGMGVSFRYMYGLTNTVEGTTYGGSAHNSAFSFTLAYKFNREK